MDLTSNSISIIEKTKTDFEEQMKANMVNETFRTTCMKAVPLKDGDPNPTGGGVGGLKGDLNNDGKVDAADHVELTKIIMTPK